MLFLLDKVARHPYKNMTMDTNAIIDPAPPAARTSQIGQ
jgi:hypothetical protein